MFQLCERAIESQPRGRVPATCSSVSSDVRDQRALLLVGRPLAIVPFMSVECAMISCPAATMSRDDRRIAFGDRGVGRDRDA